MLDCIVIGAGPGGLVTTKELLENGIHNILCLEQGDAIGGVYRHTYDSLTLTSSCTFSMYSDFWIGDGRQHHFWTKAEVLQYWTDYAQHYGVMNVLRFGKQVESAELLDDHWRLHLKDGEVLECRRLALATGGNRHINLPAWHTQLHAVEVCHSRDYRNAQRFEGKTVLVVGGGESGADIALEVSRSARQCWVSLRRSAGWILPRHRGNMAADIATHRGLYGLPRSFGSRLSRLISAHETSTNDPVNRAAAELNSRVDSPFGVWGIYGTKNFSLPEAVARHGCKVVGAVSEIRDGGREIDFADGTRLRGIDAVVFCTGYTSRVEFLPEPLQNRDPRSLFKHLLDPELGTRLAWIGMARPCFGSQFPIMEMQARYFALLCKRTLQLPALQEMHATIHRDREQFIGQLGHHAERIRSLVDYHHYMDDMAARIGCMPPLWSCFFLRPRIWLRLVYGATQATQYRLRGPGQKRQLALDILAKLPVARFNHVVKAGLRGRLLRAFGRLSATVTPTPRPSRSTAE